MAEIKQHRKRNGEKIFPVTHVEAVIGNAGVPLNEILSNKQDALISGVNIKTINGKSIVGSGGIVIEGGGSGSDMDVDSTPTEGSANLVTSGGVKSAIDAAVATAGKVDDVKVNGVSVLSGKTANITVPTKVSDLENDADYATQEDVEESKISEVEATIDDNVGTPDVDVTLTGHKLTLAFQNILGDGIASIQQTTISQESGGVNVVTVTTVGGKVGTFQILNGEKGDTVILGEGVEYTLYNGAGSNTNGAMTQAATTKEIESVILDVSAINNGATYTSLALALAAIPIDRRKTGMYIKYIQLFSATYSVVKTTDLEDTPTGAEVQDDLGIDSGIYTSEQLSDLSSLPATIGASVTYYMAVTETVDEEEVTTYTKWVVSKEKNTVQKYVQYRLMNTSWSAVPSDWEDCTLCRQYIVASEDFVNNGYINNGTLSAHADYRYTELIALEDANRIIYSNLKAPTNHPTTIAFYTYDKEYSGIVKTSTSGEILVSTLPTFVKYVRFVRHKTATASVTLEYSLKRSVTVNSQRIEAHESYLTKKKYIEEYFTGYISSSGSYVPASGYRSTDFIDVRDIMYLFATDLKGGNLYKSVTFYNASKEKLYSLDISSGGRYIDTKNLNNGEVYVRLTLTTTGTVYYVTSVLGLVNAQEQRLSRLEGTSHVNFTISSILGYISSSNGSYVYNPQYTCIKDFVPTYGADKIKCTPSRAGQSFTRFAFYNKEKSFIGISNTSADEVEVPANTYYFRATVNNSSASIECSIILYNVTFSALVEPAPGILAGKTAAFLGDSITNGYGATSLYWKLFGERTKCTAASYAVNGASIGDRHDSTVQIYEQVPNILGTESLVVVMAGTNDFGHDIPIGDLFAINDTTGEKTAPNETESFSGGLHKLVKDIIENAPNAKIIFLSPTPRVNISPTGGEVGGNYTWHRKNSIGLYLQDYVAAEKEILAFYGIPLIDLLSTTQMDVTIPAINSQYTLDGLHLLDSGHYEVFKALYHYYVNNIHIG